MKRLNSILFLLFLFMAQNAFAQDSLIMSITDFLNIVRSHHPLAYKAQLEGDKAEFYRTRAKGNFDPQLSAGINEKTFENDLYYNRINGHLKVPTYWGMQAEIGYSNNQGQYLNPMDNLPTDGLLRAGISLSLGKGLFIDERRAILKQAEIYRETTGIQQQQILNALLYDASIAYYDWFSAFYKLQISKDALANAELRINAIKNSVEQGALPGIDTVEARLQWQNILINLQSAQLEYINSKFLIESFLWLDATTPLEMDSLIRPSSIPPFILPSTTDFTDIDGFIAEHPELLYSNYNIELQQIDLSLKKEALKPSIDLQWQLISAPNASPLYDLNNYQGGAYFSYPIFTRKERADVKLSNIKLEQLQNELSNKQAELKYKIQNAISQTQTNALIWEQLQMSLDGYSQLLNAETALYLIGESSMFKLNAREMAYLKAQKNSVDAVRDYFVSEAYLKFSTFMF